MRDQVKTKEQLIAELVELRQCISQFKETGKELQQAKKILRENEEKYQSLIDDVLIGIMQVDIKGKITFVNKNVIRATGYSAEDMVGKNVFTSGLIPRGYMTVLRNRFKNKLEGSPPSPMEVQFKRKDGEWIWLQLAGKTIWKRGLPAGIQVTAENITERKQAEEKLNESEERYRTLFERTANPILVIDVNGNYVDGNEAALRHLECTGEELLIRNVRDYISPDRSSIAVMKEHKPLWKTGGEIETEYYINGKVKILKLTITPGIWKNQQVVFGIGTDITERKQIEERLKESIERLHAFGKALPDLAFILNENGRFIEILPGHENIQYKEASFSIGKTLHEVLPDEIAAPGLEAVRKAIATGETQVIEYQLNVPLGLRLFEARLSPMFSNGDGRDAVAIVIRDVTERKHAEEALRESRDYLERLTNSMVDIVLSIKLPERIIEWVNDSVVLIGYSKEECIGKTPEFLFQDRQAFLNLNKKLLAAIETNSDLERIVQVLKKKNGDLFYAEISNTIYREKGEIVRVVSILRDITESRRLQEEQAKVAKLESTGTLAGGIAHDFNNILTGIMGNIGLARRNLQDGDYGNASNRLDDAEKASLRAKDLTTQLLTFSRGGMPVKKIMSINQLLEESATLALRGSNVRLEFSLTKDLWPVEVDEGQINQVINNLIINADQAMPGGGIINVTASNIVIKRKGSVPLAKGNYTRITIEDQGTGIAPEHLSRIFDPYFTTKQKGSGLGLSVAYSIIKNHEGYIAVDSKIGSGTTFHIYLPATHEPVPIEKGITEKAPLKGEGTILVMDDEDIIRQLFCSALTQAGYEVIVTPDGENAIKEFTRAKDSGKPFDVVILDITIPGGMGGKETVKELLAIDPDVRVIVSSGYATDPIMSDYMKYGFSAVIPKPFNISELERMVKNVLNT